MHNMYSIVQLAARLEDSKLREAQENEQISHFEKEVREMELQIRHLNAETDRITNLSMSNAFFIPFPSQRN